MKKFLVVLGVCLFAFAFVAGDLLAYQEAFSISGHRTQSRNATTASIDAAYYNPVGLVKMQDGLYVDLGNRVLSLTTKTKFDALGAESESDTMTYLLPNMALAYKTGKVAVFYTFDIREGGAGGHWESGDPLITALGLGAVVSDIDATTYTFGHTLGGSFAINDMFAFSGGIRYFKKISDSEFELTAAGVGAGLLEETHSSWDGFGGYVGLLISPTAELNVSLQFQGKVMKYGREQEQGAGGGSLDESISNSPSIFLLGVAYKVMPELEVMFSYNREFTAEKKIGGTYGVYEENDTDKQVFGLGAEYRLNEMILASAGVSYKITGTDETNNGDPTDPAFDEMDIGLGAVITVMPGLNVEVGGAINIYQESENEPKTMTHNRDAWVLGFGVSYKVL